MQVHKPHSWVEWQGVNGHRYGNYADENGRIWTYNAEHLRVDCVACGEGLPEEDW